MTGRRRPDRQRGGTGRVEPVGGTRPTAPVEPAGGTRPTAPVEPAGGTRHTGPVVPVGGGVPVDLETGERFGYMPRKAAQRKIIIRRTLSLPWVIAALAAAALIAVTGIAFLAFRPDRPGKGYDDVGPLSAYPAGQVTPLRDRTGWVDRRDGLAVWLTTTPHCRTDGGWVQGAQRWDADGRVVSPPAAGSTVGGLPRGRVRAAGHRLYVDRRAVGRDDSLSPAHLGPCASPRPIG